MLGNLLTFSVTGLVQTFGYAGIAFMVFNESGLPFGFLFPGDSLLFVAGLFASEGIFNIWLLVPLVVVSAIAGDSAGYWLGRKIGPKLFTKEDSFWFNKKHIKRTEEFYTKYGARAVILARFVPVVRVFVALLAGVGLMPYGRFLSYNVIGGILWGAGVTLLAYFLGRTVPGIQHYLTYIILVILVVSMLPVLFEIFRAKKAS